jgi:3-oxoacyl-[acyl-carrier-protein] synthase III
MSLHPAVILGTGRSLPEKVLTNADLERIVDTSDEWIVTRTGIRERRVAGESEYLSQFATASAREALDMAGVKPQEVDLILCATVTPDVPLPATACFIQDQLGASKGGAFDLSAGCSGFLYALSVAKQFVATGDAKKVLVIGGELLTKYLDWKDRGTCVIFADGAGAVLIGAGEAPYGILSSALHTDGSMADYIHVPAGGTRRPTSEATVREGMHYIKMRGNETFKLAVRSLEEVCREVLEASGVGVEDVDLFVPHQANQRIINAVGTRLGLSPDKVYVNIDRIGNTSAASIPIALDECVREGRVNRGDHVLLAAFGAGLTWAGNLVRWY